MKVKEHRKKWKGNKISGSRNLKSCGYQDPPRRWAAQGRLLPGEETKTKAEGMTQGQSVPVGAAKEHGVDPGVYQYTPYRHQTSTDQVVESHGLQD